LLVAKPAYQLITNVTDDRIINVNGITDDTLLKGGAGRNPYLLEPKLPRIERGIPPTPEEAQIISDHHDYEQYKYDMQTRAYMMGPDFKEKYELENEIEVVDLYQLICFFVANYP